MVALGIISEARAVFFIRCLCTNPIKIGKRFVYIPALTKQAFTFYFIVSTLIQSMFHQLLVYSIDIYVFTLMESNETVIDI